MNQTKQIELWTKNIGKKLIIKLVNHHAEIYSRNDDLLLRVSKTKDKFMFNKIAAHLGHHIVMASYSDENNKIVNLAIECEDCYEVISDINL